MGEWKEKNRQEGEAEEEQLKGVGEEGNEGSWAHEEAERLRSTYPLMVLLSDTCWIGTRRCKRQLSSKSLENDDPGPPGIHCTPIARGLCSRGRRQVGTAISVVSMM